MHRHLSFALRTAAVSLLLAAFAIAAHADDPQARRRGPGVWRKPSFALSGVYTGVVGGQIVIDGVAYPIKPNASAYQLGYGPVPLNALAIGRVVYVTGSGAPESGIVTSVVARPASEDTDPSGDLSRFVTARTTPFDQ